MITNEQVVERVMRMGVEHRSGVPVEKLWDLAREQLKTAKPKIVPLQSYEAWAEHFWAEQEYRLAFMYVDNKLQVVRVDDPSTVSFVTWRSARLPEVKLKG